VSHADFAVEVWTSAYVFFNDLRLVALRIRCVGWGIRVGMLRYVTTSRRPHKTSLCKNMVI